MKDIEKEEIREEMLEQLDEAQEKLDEAIELLKEVCATGKEFNFDTGDLEGYIIPDLTVRSGGEHGFLTSDQSLNDVRNAIEESEIKEVEVE